MSFVLLLPALLAGEVAIQEGSVVRFASVEKAREILGTSDEFTKTVSKFDKQSRMRLAEEPSEKAFLEFIQKEAVAWDAEHQENLETVLRSVARRLKNAKLVFPKTVWLICTTGSEEGNAAYTRQNAVILPRNTLNRQRDSLERLMLHELFHVLSRHDETRRRLLYKAIGFTPVENFRYAVSLAGRRITNPDAPNVAYAMKLPLGDEKTVMAVPITYSSKTEFDPEKDGSFFQSLMFRMAVIEQNEGQWRVAENEGRPVVFDARKLPAFFEKVGKNTSYILHPDEILADNFVLWAMEDDVKSPEVIKAIDRILRKK